jgi:hypothetical protein
MKKIQFIFSLIICLCGCASGQSLKQNAKVLAFANQIDSLGAVLGPIRKQIDSMLLNSDDRDLKTWHDEDSLGSLLDVEIDLEDPATKEIIVKLSKDSVPRFNRLLLHQMELTVVELLLQKQQDSMFHDGYLRMLGFQKRGIPLSSDTMAETEESCLRNLTLEILWDAQSCTDIGDSIEGRFQPITNIERASVRLLLMNGYEHEVYILQDSLNNVLHTIQEAHGTPERWPETIAFCTNAESMFQKWIFQLVRLLQEVGRDTSDTVSNSKYDFWSIDKNFYEVMRKLNLRMQEYIQLGIKFRKTNDNSIASEMDQISDRIDSLSSEFQSKVPEFHAALKEYKAHMQ